MNSNAADNLFTLNFSTAASEFSDKLRKIDLASSILFIDTLLDVALHMKSEQLHITTVRVSNQITTVADWHMVTSYQSGNIKYSLPKVKKPIPFYFKADS